LTNNGQIRIWPTMARSGFDQQWPDPHLTNKKIQIRIWLERFGSDRIRIRNTDNKSCNSIKTDGKLISILFYIYLQPIMQAYNTIHIYITTFDYSTAGVMATMPCLGCPRKWLFGIPRKTEFFAEVTCIPRNTAEFSNTKFRGIPRYSVLFLYTEFRIWVDTKL
jgi:hypothetical protein